MSLEMVIIWTTKMVQENSNRKNEYNSIKEYQEKPKWLLILKDCFLKNSFTEKSEK